MVVNQAHLGRSKSVVLSSGSSHARVLFAGIGGSSRRRQWGLTFGKRLSRVVVSCCSRVKISLFRDGSTRA